MKSVSSVLVEPVRQDGYWTSEGTFRGVVNGTECPGTRTVDRA